jgi:cytochrome d ubiquinol oxidase subunit I
MGGALVTGSFVMAGVGAFYLLSGRHEEHGRLFVKVGVVVAAGASFFQLWPSGNAQGRLVTRHQPPTLAAMEGLFHTERGAAIVVLGQPNTDEQRLDNPLYVPRALSFLTFRNWEAEVRGLDAFPRDRWPDNIPLLYYCYHIMVGLGTLFVAVAAGAVFLLWRGRLFTARWMLWLVMLSSPAVGRLRAPAHRTGVLPHRLGGQRPVHADGLHGNVRAAQHRVPLPDRTRDKIRGPKSEGNSNDQ